MDVDSFQGLPKVQHIKEKLMFIFRSEIRYEQNKMMVAKNDI